MPKTIVIGGGISGLAAAYALQKSEADYLLIEASDHLGGKIVTYAGEGFLIEGGPDSFLTQKRAALDLCRELGLGDQLIGSNHTATPSTYVLSKGKLHPMPEGMMLMAPTMILPILRSELISWPGKLRMGLEIFIGRNTTVADESLGSFVRRRMGSELLAKIAGPLMAGIHAGDPEALSLRSTFPMFTDMEKTHRSLVLGMMKRKKAQAAQLTTGPRPSMFTTLSGGLQQLPNAIAARLNPQQVKLNTRVQSVAAAGGQYRISLADGTSLIADNVVFTTPAYVTAEILQQLTPALAEKLRRIRYVSTSTVSLAFRRSEITCDLNGFGFIVPAAEGRKINACSWSSTKFSHRAPDDFVLMRVFIGGAFAEDLAEQDEATLIDIARNELRDIMGITATPVLARAYRWTKSNPQYNVGHGALIKEIDQLVSAHPGLYLAGAAYRGSGIPDCIQSGVDTAAKIVPRQTSSNPAISHAAPAFVAT
ncbi:protoporphyrinogen oxidase [Granulicella sp. L46]|uniref:protoporphyrinogen oxidase n=1 Tax=Granulicella sp. L46 TaxID=1641865 RepID=UPI00131D2EBB|nr:protoporphyrinogen oxidase [Granulicella sp. L46]